MIYGIWSSAAGMAANQYRLDVTSNNLANVDTVGFKHDIALLLERPVASQEEPANARYRNVFFDRLGGGTLVAPTVHSFAEGHPIETGKPLDARIEGQGFFQVQTPDGVRYTRDGRFLIDEAGTLVTAAGTHPVLSAAAAPIRVTGGPEPLISQLGQILQGSAAVAQLGVVEFSDLTQLRKVGGNLFAAADGAVSQPAATSRIVPRQVEASTVDPLNGIAQMIEISHAFEMNANMLKMQDQTLAKAVNDIARV